MDLEKYEEKCVRLTTIWGEVFEGTAEYFSEEYVIHEYGYDQEALQIVPILFRRDDIADIVSLEDVDGPFGHFSGRYGLLEEKCLEWGTDMMEEVFDSEDDIQTLRMLTCMEDHFTELMDRAVPGMAPWRSGGTSDQQEDESEQGPVYLGELKNMLGSLVKYNEDAEVVKKAKGLLERIADHYS